MVVCSPHHHFVSDSVLLPWYHKEEEFHNKHKIKKNEIEPSGSYQNTIIRIKKDTDRFALCLFLSTRFKTALTKGKIEFQPVLIIAQAERFLF